MRCRSGASDARERPGIASCRYRSHRDRFSAPLMIRLSVSSRANPNLVSEAVRPTERDDGEYRGLGRLWCVLAPPHRVQELIR